MDIRKIQATGGASLSITLPKKWINRMHLKDKDEVIISEQKNGNLTLRSKKHQTHIRNGVLTITNENKDYLRRYISSSYKIGLEELTIKISNGQKLDKSEIRKLASKLMGWEIVKEGENFIVLHNILDITRIPLGQTLKQLFASSREMLRDAGKIILDADQRLAMDIIERDDEADKLCLLIERAYFSVLTGRVTEEEISHPTKVIGYYRDVAIQLERICDHAVKMAKVTLLESRQADRQKLEKILEKLIRILNQLEILVTSEELEQANQVSEKINRLKKETLFTHKEIDDYNFTEILLHDSLNRIRGLLNNIIEDIIDQIVMRSYR